MADRKQNEDAEALRQVADLARSGVAELVRVANLFQAAARGDLGSPSPASAATTMLKEAPRLTTALARASLDAQTTLLRIGGEHLDRLTKSLYEANRPSLTLRADVASGGRARLPFRLRNPDADATTISFTTLTFHQDGRRTPTGSQVKRVADGRETDDLTLQPNEHGRFVLYVDVAPDHPTGSFHADLKIVGNDNVLGTIAVELQVTARKIVRARWADEEGTVETEPFRITNRTSVTGFPSVACPVPCTEISGKVFAAMALVHPFQEITPGRDAKLSVRLHIPEHPSGKAFVATATVLVGGQVVEIVEIHAGADE